MRWLRETFPCARGSSSSASHNQQTQRPHPDWDGISHHPPIQPTATGSPSHRVPDNTARDAGPNHHWTASCCMPGCVLMCRNATMAAILGIARTTATQFQLQREINSSFPLPFPTPTEETELRQAYNMASNRGYPLPPLYAALIYGMETAIGLFCDCLS